MQPWKYLKVWVTVVMIGDRMMADSVCEMKLKNTELCIRDVCARVWQTYSQSSARGATDNNTRTLSFNHKNKLCVTTAFVVDGLVPHVLESIGHPV